MLLGAVMSVPAAPTCRVGAGVQPTPFCGRLQWSRWSQCPALSSFAHYGGIEKGSSALACALTSLDTSTWLRISADPL